jgi:hypothetical protein
VGCADRSAFDLTQHTKATGVRLAAEKKLAEPKVVDVTGERPNCGCMFVGTSLELCIQCILSKHMEIKLYVVLTVHLITVEIYFTLPAYAQYLTMVSIYPYTYFGLLTAILRGSQC